MLQESHTVKTLDPQTYEAQKMIIGKVKIQLIKNTRGDTSTITNVIHILDTLTDFLPVRKMVEGKTNLSYFRDL
jgi:hypothetical protein